MSSSSSSSSSSVAELHMSSPSLSPRLSLQSPQLQAEFLRECQNKLRLHSDESDDGILSPVTAPSTPTTPKPCFQDSRFARLSLTSPELLLELRQSRSLSLRHVAPRTGMTTVFSGRGRHNSHPTSPHQPIR
ncbi:uncharacterized protein ACB058_001444 [Synchiropus picturatus]